MVVGQDPSLLFHSGRNTASSPAKTLMHRHLLNHRYYTGHISLHTKRPSTVPSVYHEHIISGTSGRDPFKFGTNFY